MTLLLSRTATRFLHYKPLAQRIGSFQHQKYLRLVVQEQHIRYLSITGISLSILLSHISTFQQPTLHIGHGLQVKCKMHILQELNTNQMPWFSIPLALQWICPPSSLNLKSVLQHNSQLLLVWLTCWFHRRYEHWRERKMLHRYIPKYQCQG